jgi:hypothetical protein
MWCKIVAMMDYKNIRENQKRRERQDDRMGGMHEVSKPGNLAAHIRYLCDLLLGAGTSICNPLISNGALRKSLICNIDIL